MNRMRRYPQILFASLLAMASLSSSAQTFPGGNINPSGTAMTNSVPGTAPSTMDCIVSNTCQQNIGTAGSANGAYGTQVATPGLPVNVSITSTTAPGAGVFLNWTVTNGTRASLVCQAQSSVFNTAVGATGSNYKVPGSESWSPGRYQCQIVAWGSSMQTSNASTDFEIQPVGAVAVPGTPASIAANAGTSPAAGGSTSPSNVTAPATSPVALAPPVISPMTPVETDDDMTLVVRSGIDGVSIAYGVPTGRSGRLSCRPAGSSRSVFESSVSGSSLADMVDTRRWVSGNYTCSLSAGDVSRTVSFVYDSTLQAVANPDHLVVAPSPDSTPVRTPRATTSPVGRAPGQPTENGSLGRPTTSTLQDR